MGRAVHRCVCTHDHNLYLCLPLLIQPCSGFLFERMLRGYIVHRRQLRRHAETLNAAAVLLTQQALALRSGPALAWQLVDHLMLRPSWQKRLQQKRGEVERAAAAGAGTGVPPVEAQRIERMALRETGLLALHAVLDDGSLVRRSEAGEVRRVSGWYPGATIRPMGPRGRCLLFGS